MGNQAHPDIVQVAHMIQAIEGATRHLAAGVRMVSEPGWQARTGQPAFLEMATGVEKLGKLTCGMWKLEASGDYLSDKESRGLDHNIATLATSVHDEMRARAEADGKAYVSQLARDLDADPYWPDVLATLACAADATEGRYRHEGALGGKTLSGDAPADIWGTAEHKAVTALRLWLEVGSVTEAPAALAKIRAELLRSVLRWWHLAYRGWQHGLAGPKAHQLSTEAGLEFDRLPDELSAFVKAL